MSFNLIPQPEVIERSDPLIWIEWDKAVEFQDDAGLSLVPIEQDVMLSKLSARCVFRKEAVL